MSAAEAAIRLHSSGPAHDVGHSHHSVQLYEDDAFLLGTLSRVLDQAFGRGHAAIVVATRAHLDGLELRLREDGTDMATVLGRRQCVLLEASGLLSRLLVADQPDAERFAALVEPVVADAVRRFEGVVVFGEMVSLLGQQGRHDAAIRLEELWNELGARHRFSLICAYRMSEFTQHTSAAAFAGICDRHTHVLPAEGYMALSTPGERLREIAVLQQKAAAFDSAVELCKRLQREVERLQAQRVDGEQRERLLVTLARELRNPLAPMRYAVELTRSTDSDRALLCVSSTIIQRQLGYLAHLADDLVEVSRAVEGRLSLHKERTDLCRILAAALDATRELMEDKDLEIHFEQPEEPLWLDADASRLIRVFAHLLGNGVKYSGPGERILLRLERREHEAVVDVRDFGRGIAPHELPDVFDVFARGGSTDGGTPGGLGIGLTLVRHIVRLHGGRVDVHSDGLGTGSTFTVRLPLSAAPSEGISSMGHSFPTETATPSTQRRIIVADDHRDAAMTLALLLRLEGHEVRTAHDGAEVLEIVNGFRPDIILLDIGMPRLDGYETARRLRAQAWTSGLRLIALTGWGHEEDRRRTMQAGFDDHLTKPVDPARLLRLIEEVSPGVA